MRILQACFLLLILLGNGTTGASQELVSRIKSTIKDKEPSWQPVAEERTSGFRFLGVDKRSSPSTNYKWKSGQEWVAAEIFVADSEQAADEMLYQRGMIFPLGPKAMPNDLGDEAFLFQGERTAGGTILFRKSTTFVYMNGSSIGNVKRFALHIANLIATK
jgi:hypothetical protein